MTMVSLAPAISQDDIPHVGDKLTLVEAIEAALGKVVFVDLTYPTCACPVLGHGETRFALLADTDARKMDFVSALRQMGGQQPVGTVSHVTRSGGFSALRPTLPVGRMPIYFVTSLALAATLVSLLDEEAAGFLLPVTSDASSLFFNNNTAMPANAFAGFSSRGFRDEASGTGYLLVYRAGRQRGVAAPVRMEQDFAPVQDILPLPRDKRVISARHMVHDGGYTAEGDESYSWLWTGPHRCFRILVPRRTDDFPRRIEMSIARTENPQNLDQIRVQLDGRHVPFAFDRWSDTSGKVVVDLPTCHDYTVLGLIIPTLDKDKYSGRAIGLCVDKLILLPE